MTGPAEAENAQDGELHAAAPPAVRLRHVSKSYRTYAHPSHRLKQTLMRGRKIYFQEHVALAPLSLTIPRGQTVGVIGVNGSGKSTLLQLVTRTLTPTTGSVEVHGRLCALLELGAGFNPEFSGHENIFLNASIMGMKQAEIQARYEAIVQFSGLDRAMLAKPVNTYSSGMYVRLAFAVAIAADPDILIVDEALAVGDEGFQRKCFARIREIQENGATILFVSHSARTILELCSHAILLDSGALIARGTPATVVAQYHRMIFASERERPAIRARIQEESAEAEGLEAGTAAQDTAAAATADPACAGDAPPAPPETRDEYPPEGGYITDVALSDSLGQHARFLSPGTRYRLSYRLHVTAALRQVRCAMLIKTLRGIELAGTVAYGTDEALDQLAPGACYLIRFEFVCRLNPGDYFINVGAVEHLFGRNRFVHRVVDALHIKVAEPLQLRSRHLKPTGFVDIGAECDIIREEANEHELR